MIGTTLVCLLKKVFKVDQLSDGRLCVDLTKEMVLGYLFDFISKIKQLSLSGEDRTDLRLLLEEQ